MCALMAEYRQHPDCAGRGSVLLADPAIEENCDLAREISRLGHPVYVAPDLNSSWCCIENEPIRFALIELRFGQLTSFRLIREISTFRPKCRIVVYSSFCNIETTVRAMKAGAADVLPKPLNPSFVAGILLDRPLEALAGEGVFQEPELVLRDHILSIYNESNFNVSRAAKRLSMHRRSLQRYLKRNQLLHRELHLTT